MSADNWTVCPKCGTDATSENTFREDYEIGVFRNAFDVEYKGQCMSCGFELKYNHSELIK